LKRLLTRLAICCSVLALLPGCSAFSAKDNADPPAELVEFTPELKVETLWDLSLADTDQRFLSLRPIMRGDRLYIADPDGRVMALDAVSGKHLWKQHTDTPLSGGPGVAGGLVVLGTADGELLALDRESGETRWRRNISSEVLSVPAGASGLVVVRTVDGRVEGLQAGTGETRWSFHRSVPVLTLRGNGSPLINDSRVIVGFASGKLASLSLETGNLVWETTVSTPSGRTELERIIDLDADPVLVEGVIFVVGYQGSVAAVSESTGVVLWKRDFSSHAGLDADWRQIYLTDGEDHVWSLDASNGATLWQQQALHARKLSAPAIAGDYILVGDREGYLHWLAQYDGRMLARTKVGSDGIRIKPLVVDGMVYVLDDGGRLAALKAEPVDSDQSVDTE
jgi:outer membrane protein assembly factor BamB